MTAPSRYERVGLLALNATQAEGLILIIVGGVHGHGFTLHATDPEFHREVPALLRNLAAQIEAESRAPTFVTCSRCGRTSYNVNDIAERYCGACHEVIP